MNIGPRDKVNRAGPRRRIGNIGVTIDGATRRLFRARAIGSERVWTRGLTVAVIASLILTAAAAAIDRQALIVARNSMDPVIVALRYFTNISMYHRWMLPALFVLLIVAASDWSALRGRALAFRVLLYSQAVFALSALTATLAASQLAKILIGRARPKLIGEAGPFAFHPFTGGYDYASLPSGHATACGTLAALAILWFPRAGWLVAAAMAFLSSSRVATGAHYPSDIVAGFALGALLTVVLARWLGARRMAFRLVPGCSLPTKRHGAKRPGRPSGNVPVR